MALLAPVAFAAAGGLLSGGATWGMAAGWLIGSWLFGPKAEEDNKIFDPGAEEMPRFNQALRGSTLPVLFGTNRVSSQVVWTKNFTTIRNESKSSSGGGKGGGSGMGSKAGQPSSTEVTYEYSWDVMFHIGMSDQNVDLLGAWLGTEPMNGATIGSIISGSDSQWATYAGLGGQSQEGADLNFEDSYFHGAGATGGTFDNWTHFQTEEGGGYRWPYTAYVGFKQLYLGNTARIPQITWEVGEGNLSLEYDGFYLSDYGPISTTYGSDELTCAPSGLIVKAADTGELLAIPTTMGGTNTHCEVRRVSDGTLVSTLLDTEFDTWWDDLGLGTRPVMNLGTDAAFTDVSMTSIIPGTNYVLHWGISFYNFGNRMYHLFVLTTVNSDGSFNLLGYYATASESRFYRGNDHIAGRFGQQTNDDLIIWPILTAANLASGRNFLALPSINQLIAGINNADHTQYNMDTERNLGTPYDGIFPGATFPQSIQYPNTTKNIVRNVNYGGPFLLPTAEVGALGVTWGSRLYWFFPKNVLVENNSDPLAVYYHPELDTLYGTNPEGVFVYVDLTLSGSLPSLSASYTIVPADFITNTAGANVYPFDDAQLAEDLTAEPQNDYTQLPYNIPLTQGIGAGGNLVIFSKSSDDTSTDHAGTGSWHRLRVCIWNPLTQKFIQYLTAAGPICDVVDDLGASNKTSTQIGGNTCYYDQDNNALYIHGDYQANSIPDEVYVVGRFGDLTISGGTDLTPPAIIYRILTSSVFGLGIDPSLIDNTSYGLANQYCEAENIKVSVQYRREESALAVIDELLSLYGGFLIDSGGQIKFGLQEFSSAVIKTIDNDRLRIDQEGEAPVTITKGARQDTYNRVKVNYFDRSLAYRQNFIEIADEVDMDLNGVRAQEFPAKFVMSEATALKLATRALWGNMYARDIYDFKLGSKDADLEPGDVITLVDSYHSELQSGKQARIVQWQETAPLTFQVRAVEEVQYVNASTLAPDNVTEATSNTLFARTQPVADFRMYELPAEFQGADAQLFVGYRQQMAAMGARLYLSADGVSYALADEAEPYIISGMLKGNLPVRAPGFFEENVEVYLMPETSSVAFNPSSPLYAQNHALDDVSAAGRALGTGNLWIGSEMCAFEGANLIAQNHYRFDRLYRGWGGTHIHAHNSGDTWWKHGGGIFAETINADKIGTTIYYKVTNYNFAGQEYPVTSVDAKTYQILGTFWRPQVQAPIATYVQSPASYLTIQSEDLGVIQKKRVVTGGSPVQFEWPQAAQEAGYGAQGYGVGGYGRFTQDTTSVSYRIEVLSTDYSTVVRCTTVDTTAFLYSTALNSEDWNGWTGSFAVRITPYNPYGTALRSRTKILELFE